MNVEPALIENLTAIAAEINAHVAELVATGVMNPDDPFHDPASCLVRDAQVMKDMLKKVSPAFPFPT